MEQLKKRIINHLDIGRDLEKCCHKYDLEVPNPDYLNGFRRGLKFVLSVISEIEEGEKDATRAQNRNAVK